MSEAKDEAVPAAPPKSKKKLIIIVGALLVVLAGGGAGAWFFMGRGGEGTEQAKEEPPKPPVYLPLETFTVNLRDSEQFLQLDLTLQVADQAQIDAIKLHMPRVRSRMLALLSSQDTEALLAPEGKQTLARDIMEALNQPFEPKGKPQQVVDVLFTSFVIQ
jgi:flagellar FliL protein